MSMNYAHDPDDLYGEQIVFTLQINVRKNGSMSIGGHIDETEYACACLDAAKSEIRSRAQKRIADGLIVPAKDTPRLVT